MPRALICGVSGQDGAYLAKLLLSKGYAVYGTSRDIEVNDFRNLRSLGVKDDVKLLSLSTADFRSILEVLRQSEPDEIYNLSGQTSVGLSFLQPVETISSIAIATLNLLEAVRFSNLQAKIYNAGSIECFGDCGSTAVNEETAFHPRSPYGVAKSTAHWTIRNYREAYGLFACTGILSNHESPLRPERFVTRKIIRGALRIARGEDQALQLGSLDVIRDWGWAPEYVEAMWKMLQQPVAEDLVIGTGRSYGLRDFVAEAFAALGLDWKEHVTEDASLRRPADITESRVDCTRANRQLGWRARNAMPDVVRMMIEAEQHGT